MSIWITHSADKWATSRPSQPTLTVVETEIEAILYGPDGEPMKYKVDRRKLPIGFQKEPK